MTSIGRVTTLLCLVFASCPAWSAPAAGEWSIELTPDEHAWIREHPVVRVGQICDFGPFSFVNQRGQVEGMNVDYLDIIESKTGLRFETVISKNLEAAFERLQKQEIDLVMGIGRQPQREEFMRFTSVPFEYSPDAIVTRTDAPFLFDLRALDGEHLGIASSSSALLGTLSKQAPNSRVTTFPSIAEAVRAVAHGEVFAAITDASVAAFTVKHEHLTNLRLGGVFATGDLHVGVRPDYEPLVSILDKVFAAMPASDHARIEGKWMALDYESDRRWERASQVLIGVLLLAALAGAAMTWNARRRAREIAEQKRIHEELKTTRDALEVANRGQRSLMRMIAHDLRNPLTTLGMSVETLELNHTPDLQREILGDIHESLHWLRALIDTLLDVQSIEDGRRSYKREVTSVSHVVRQAITAFQEVAARKRILLRIEGPELPTIQSDGAALRQAADNLISNAIKYSPLGAEVLVTVSFDDNWVRFSVRDAGPGIGAAEQARLFKKYGRGTARPTGGEASIGFGLWIVQQLADGLRAQVSCESQAGSGSTFTFQVARQTEQA